MTTLFYTNDSASENFDCVVKIHDGEILVEYLDDGNVLQYVGSETGKGHFELSCSQLSGKASLHMFEGSEILEGSWIESGYRGMWKITLADSVK